MHSKRTLAVYTTAHFCVDYACFFLLFAWLASRPDGLAEVAAGFLIYNLLAFGLQPFIGLLCDGWPRIPAGVIGCALLLAALGVSVLPFAAAPWVALPLAAVGNAGFHIGGGRDSLIHAGRSAGGPRMARGGIFVSSGALGVVLGTLSGRAGNVPLWVPAALTGLSLAGIAALCSRRGEPPPAPSDGTGRGRQAGIVILLCCLSIAVRSYGGSVIPIGWKTTALLSLLPGIAAFVGKLSGGLLADRLGARLVGVGSLSLSLPLLTLGYGSPAACTAGLVLFNMSMAVTLCAIAARLPGNPGFAFGLTTLALVCGNVPTFFIPLPPAAAPFVMGILTVLSALCLWAALSPPLTNRRLAHV